MTFNKFDITTINSLRKVLDTVELVRLETNLRTPHLLAVIPSPETPLGAKTRCISHCKIDAPLVEGKVFSWARYN